MAATPKAPADETKANHAEPRTIRTALICSCQQLQDMIEDKSLREVSVTSLVLEFCIPTKDIGGNDHQPWGEQTLDLQSFSHLQSLCIKERTGKIRFKKKGEDPHAHSRMTLILPKDRDDDGFQNVTFEWLGRTSENYYDGLSESLRKELYNQEGIQIKEWVRDETMVQKKLFTLEEMEENKWKTRVAKLKGVSSYVERPDELKDVPIDQEPFTDGEMVLAYKRKLLDGTLEFDVLEVANASLVESDVATSDQERDARLCVEDRESTWRERWKETSPEEYYRHGEVHCFFSVPTVSMLSYSRNWLFRSLPCVKGYGPTSLRGSFYRGSLVGAVLQLKMQTPPHSIACPACRTCFKDLESVTAHITDMRNIVTKNVKTHHSQVKPTEMDHQRVFMKHLWPLQRDVSLDLVKDSGWGAGLDLLMNGNKARSQCSRPVNRDELRRYRREDKARAARFSEACKQAEYYLSDMNLRSDTFYRPRISASKEGWFEMQHVMSAPRMKSKDINMEELAVALLESQSVEARQTVDGSYWIRRKGGKKLPAFIANSSYNSYHGRRRNYYGDFDSSYGYGGGYLHHSAGDCDALLKQDVKPCDYETDSLSTTTSTTTDL